jgi:hypothetical protein
VKISVPSAGSGCPREKTPLNKSRGREIKIEMELRTTAIGSQNQAEFCYFAFRREWNEATEDLSAPPPLPSVKGLEGGLGRGRRQGYVKSPLYSPPSLSLMMNIQGCMFVVVIVFVKMSKGDGDQE